MTPEEKDRLLFLFENETKCYRDAEAHAANGDAVWYDDTQAVAWDITGALCQLFGWHRACVLFEQVDRHIHGKHLTMAWPPRDSELEAMLALQDYNDQPTTTFEILRGRLEAMPVWRGSPREHSDIKNELAQ